MKPIHSAPVCIASPTRRSGTTLIQRLLCSASDTLIYGETAANDLNILASLLSTKEMLFSHGTDYRDAQLNRVLTGEVNEWIADLLPPAAHYIGMYRESLLNFSDKLAAYATTQQRPVWGVKMAQWNPAQLLQLTRLIPGTKVIYLHRQLADCVRSAKRLEFVVDLNDVQQFCHTWKQFGDYARQHLVGDHALHLNYEDLLADPDVWLPRLADFAGAAALDHGVLQARINTDAHDTRLAEATKPYLPPAELSTEELAVVAQFDPTQVPNN